MVVTVGYTIGEPLTATPPPGVKNADDAFVEVQESVTGWPEPALAVEKMLHVGVTNPCAFAVLKEAVAMPASAANASTANMTLPEILCVFIQVWI